MQVFDGAYDAFLASQLCASYQNGSPSREVLNELLAQVGPLINIVLRSEFVGSLYNIGETNVDELRSDALVKLWTVFTEKEIETDNPHRFTAYLWTTIRNSIHDTFRFSATHEFDYFYIARDEPMSARLDTHDDADRRVYLKQYNKLLIHSFRADCRFEGKEYSACCWMADQIVYGTNKSLIAAKMLYKLTTKQLQFLINYTKVTVKTIARDLKQIDDAAV